MSGNPLFQQNKIAIVWDFDKTLSPGYMQAPIFEEYDVDEAKFWTEVQALPDYYARAGIQLQEDTAYLTHLISYVQHGVMPDLSNAKLRELGARITLFPGLPDAFASLKAIVDEEPYISAEIGLEHYIVSTGLSALIEGSAIAKHVDGIWASIFIEEPAKPGQDLNGIPRSSPITQVAGFLDNTTKTRALFEINKGVNKEPRIRVNDKIDEDDRRVPFRNMIYVADGPSDVPSFSVVRRHGGLTFAVYDEDSEQHLQQVDKLRDGGRVHMIGPANYLPENFTLRWLKLKVREIADDITRRRSDAINVRVAPGPKHI